MKYTALGDRQASVIGLGLWQFGSPQWGWGDAFGEPEAHAIVQRALDLGINLFDTAELYGNGRSEEIFGRALAGRRSEAIIATKVTPHHITERGVIAAAERSLERLGTDAIDLYQVHWPNRFVPITSTMRGMRALLQSDKIRAVGVSNFGLRRWRRAESALGAPVIANQVQFHLLDQGPVDDLLPYARQKGRAVLAYSPLAQGVLAGRYNATTAPTDFRASSSDFSPAAFERVSPLLDALREIAAHHGATPAQVALAWLVSQPNVIAIPGARSVEQVEQNAAAADLDLSAADLARLGELGRGLAPAGRPLLRRAAAWLLGA
jgi:aryl-alcohol dehydrogenase-like predicted oxidoreductase